MTPPASIPPSFYGTSVKSTLSSQKGSEQIYSDSNWAQFPDPPTQDNILAWWFHLQEDLLSESHSTYYTTASKVDLTGLKAELQVDLLLRARGGRPLQNKHDWRDILMVGELKNSKKKLRIKDTLLQIGHCMHEVFAAQLTLWFIHTFTICGTKMEAWVFDRSGAYSSGVINIHADLRQFLQVLVGYTMMSDEELGLDIFIARDEGGSKSITVKEPGSSEEMVLQLSEILFFQCAIVCCGTTCFLTGNGQVEGVAKLSWVSDKQHSEVELFKLAGQKNVQGVARIIGHSTITSIADMRCSLTFDDKHHNFKSTSPSTASSFHQSCQKSSSRKRRSPGKGMQVSKQSRSTNQLSRAPQQENELAFSIQSAHQPSLFNRNGEEPYDDCVLCCLVISPAGQPIYKYKSPLELLMVLHGAIKAHQSLYLDGNILHQDISENNIIITDPEKADGHSGRLIDLDLAKEVRSGRSGAQHQTGTMEFMAIEVLLNIDHTYRHDLEPEFSMLRKWYTGSYEEIATYKRGNMEAGGFERILMKEFPPWLYDPIIKAYDDAIALIETE
ncbi:uncharacterized protein PADG_00198 [Paracoccidioides brasiliensis Pb18]|uniref:Protein kinase domain-containing protein n=1 Tax=Paracoccidioides brasiliensis (strain Pb18) TaxID=502780 RepID=C1G008_PARBD|nr:uncharacterized protein PADG_00198 [Paracoccidioides brasiliensis Pb18]EEH43909.2 hypothetical protein PADG_00198 [Paracoccidioides brasiliensis Pb18]